MEPEKKKVYGYARVSTPQQSLELQEEAIVRYCKYRDLDLMRIFSDKSTGKNTDRPAFQEMMLFLDENMLGISVVVITKLDRIARSIRDLLVFFDWCRDHKINVVAINNNIDTTSSEGRLFLYMMGALSEFERELIEERTKEGKKRYLENGGRMGPKVKPVPIHEVRRLLSMGVPVSKIAKQFKLSRATIYNRLKEDDKKKIENIEKKMMAGEMK
jgi:DNA invertase Pin-like site-specific DNA recombinase